MKSKVNNPNYLVNFCLMIIIWLLIQTVFMRFVHYDAQHRLLDPEHYNVKVITQDDYKQWSNPQNRSVELSNGSVITKADSWDESSLTSYKAVNNDSQYVEVTLKGTAAFMHKWYEFAIPILCMVVVYTLIAIKKSKQGNLTK
jgi:hypothetical protein